MAYSAGFDCFRVSWFPRPSETLAPEWYGNGELWQALR